MTHPTHSADEVRIGISACLLGQKVRWDGGHKHDPFLTHTLGQLVTFVPVCPEVEAGFGTPRETLRLVDAAGGTRMVETKSALDHTDTMRRYAERRARDLAAENLCGYVLKKDSPSCGVFRVKRYDVHGNSKKDGRGLFAEALIAALPLLPVEEEGRLHDPVLRENFFERVFAYRRLRRLFESSWRAGDLVAFHTREKLLLMAHSPSAYAALGRLVAGAKGRPRAELAAEYQERFLGALAVHATKGRHVNVLQHMAGYFSELLSADERGELEALFAEYRAGRVPLVVPVTLVRHHVRRHAVGYLQGQTYLDPHPKELMLRNHA